jgi:hypothetical protein
MTVETARETMIKTLELFDGPVIRVLANDFCGWIERTTKTASKTGKCRAVDMEKFIGFFERIVRVSKAFRKFLALAEKRKGGSHGAKRIIGGQKPRQPRSSVR